MEQAQEEQQLQDYGIDMSTLIQEWKTAKTWTDRFTRDFPTLDTLADGVPITTQNGNPYVGDTTIAGIVRSLPRESLQQLPIFGAVINGSKVTIPAIVCSFLLRKSVFNEDTFGKGLLSTCQMATEEAIKHGYAPVMCATGPMYDEFGSTMKLLHYADVAPEPGVQDASESGCFYVSTGLTKSRVRRIIKAAENNPNTTWNVEALKQLVQIEPETANYSMYDTPARNQGTQGQATPVYLFVTRKEVGKKAKDITFCEQLQDIPLRTVVSKSKFGFPRVQFLVIDPVPLVPFGLSRVRLASPNQNLMNAYYQNIASMFILNSKPPVLKRGRFTKPIQLKQGAVWETIDQNATVELKEMSNSSLQQFVEISKQMSSQIQNMMGKPIRNTDLGNTSPGAKQQIKYEDTSTNQITNILENFLRQYGLVALDTHISEQVGEATLILDDEAKDAINQVGMQNFMPTPEQPEYIPIVGDDNKFVINWDDFYRGPVKKNELTNEPILDAEGNEIREGGIEDMSVTIELSINKDELEEKTRGDLQDQLTVMAQTADPNDPEKQARIRQIEDKLLEKSLPEAKPMGPPPIQIPQTTEMGPQMSRTE